MKKQKIQGTTTPLPLPELPAEVWRMIVLQLTRGGNPWLAGRLSNACLTADNHALGYQARLLFSEIRDRFWDLYIEMEELPPSIASFSDYTTSRPRAEYVKDSCEMFLWRIEDVTLLCGKAMSNPLPTGLAVMAKTHGTTQDMHVAVWGAYLKTQFPNSLLLISIGLTKLRTPWFCVTFIFSRADQKNRNMAKVARWFAWTTASVAEEMAMDFRVEANYTDSNRTAMEVEWDKWNEERLNAFVALVTQLKQSKNNFPLEFIADVGIREDVSDKLPGITYRT